MKFIFKLPLNIVLLLFGIVRVVIRSVINSIIRIGSLFFVAAKIIRKKGILQASKMAAVGTVKTLFKAIKRVGEEIVTFRRNLKRLKKTVPLVLKKPSKAILDITADIRTTSKAIPPVDGRIPKGAIVTLQKQYDFTSNLFETVKKRFLKNDAEGFRKNMKSWFTSTSKRSRLVIVQANNQDAGDLADLICDGISLDRFLLTGLTVDKSKQLLEKLKAKWNQKLSDTQIDNLRAELHDLEHERAHKLIFPSKKKRSNLKKIKGKSAELAIAIKNQAEFIELFKSKDIPWDEDQDSDFESVLRYCTLKQLMGPHMFQSEIGVGYERVKKLDDHFHVNIEEVFCYGTDNKLAKDAILLAKKIGDGVPLFSLRSEDYETCSKNEEGKQIQGAWTGAVKNKEFIKKITEGLSTKEFFQKDEDNPQLYKDIQISKNFQELFDLDSLKELMNSDVGDFKGIDKTRIDLIDIHDIDFFKEIFLEEGLYASATPKGISRTISSAASQLAAKKAEDVASSLKQNAINRPTSSAVEVEFTNGTITLDVGGDIVKERLDKNNSYKLLYSSILENTITQYPEISTERALKIAFSQTLSTYIEIEKKNTIVKELERGRTGADTWRAFGTKSINKIIEYNDKAIDILDKGGYIFGAQVALQVASAINPLAGSLAFGVVGANAVPWSVNSVALTGIAHGIETQIEALRVHTTNTNTAFSVASGLKYDSQRERDLQVHKAISDFKKELASQKSENSQAKFNLAKFNEKQISDPHISVTEDYNDDQESIEQEMIAEIAQITKSENFTGLVDLPPDGLYTVKIQKDHVIKMLDLQAQRSKKCAEIQYNKNIISWAASASSRARLVIIEPEDHNMERLAQIAFNASPLERVLITGVDSKAKADSLKDELKKLWIQKLEDSNVDNETDRAIILRNRVLFEHKYNKIDEELNWRELIENLELEQLMGPHLFKKDIDISYESMNADFEFFDICIEEILLFGKSDELVTNLANLSQKSRNKPPSFSVKSEAIKQGDGPWKCEAIRPSEFLNDIAKGLGSTKIIGLQETTTNDIVTKTYENIKISPIFEKLFDIKFIEEISAHLEEHGNHDEGHRIAQKDLDYIKEIIIDECLYSADTSPEAIAKTISKASSILLALGTRNISNHLYPNMIGYAYNSILEVIYANVSSTMDAGTDLIKEGLDKKNQYKALFDQLLDIAIHSNSSTNEEQPTIEEKVCLSFVETLECYHNNENINEDIKETLEGEKGAIKHREASIHYINKCEAAAQTAATILQVQLPLQAASYGVGIATSIVTGGVLAPLFITGAAIGGASILTKLTAMEILAHANGRLIPNVNQTSGIANAKNYEAKQLRATEIEKTQMIMRGSLTHQRTNPKLVAYIYKAHHQGDSCPILSEASVINSEPAEQNGDMILSNQTEMNGHGPASLPTLLGRQKEESEISESRPRRVAKQKKHQNKVYHLCENDESFTESMQSESRSDYQSYDVRSRLSNELKRKEFKYSRLIF